MKKLIMMVMIMVVMSMACGCSMRAMAEQKKEEPVKTEYVKVRLDDIINEQVDKYVQENNIKYNSIDVDIKVEDGNTIVCITYYYKGEIKGSQTLRVVGAEFFMQ